MPSEAFLDGDLRVRNRFFWFPFQYGRTEYWMERAWFVERYTPPITDCYGVYSCGGWSPVRPATGEDIIEMSVVP